MASDGAASDKFGSSLCLFGDSLMVGAPYDDTLAGADTGSAYFYRFVDSPTSLPSSQPSSLPSASPDGQPTSQPTARPK